MKRTSNIKKSAGLRKKALSDVTGLGHLEKLVRERTEELGKLNRLLRQEIAGRKLAENALRVNESRFRIMAETSRDIIFQTDLQGRITYCSPAIKEYGYSPEAVIQSHFSEYFSRDEFPKVEGMFRRIISGEHIELVELKALKADGSPAFIEINAAPVMEEGSVVGVQGIARDIAARKQAEESLLRTKEDLEVRVRERTEILSRTNELLKLFSHTFLKKEYLDAATELLSQWCDCRCAAIRLIDESGNILYVALKGFSRKFWEQQHCLSIKKDFCVCARIMTEKPATPESPFLTPSGSFFCNDTSLLRPVRRRGRVPYRGTCLEHGYVSVAAVPIRHRGTVLGAIHLADKRNERFPLPIMELIESITPLIGEALYRFSVEEALFASRQQLRNLSAHLLAAREEERRKIAREIHDELGQTLTAASMELGRINKKGRLSAPASEYITSASSLIDTAVEDIQRICSDLRPRVLDHLGLKAAIEWQSKRFSLHTGIPCHLKLGGSFRQLPETVSTALFRIFQETLTNVARHSGASEVSIHLDAEDNALILRIRDNGKGVSKQQLFGEQSLGILGIRERAHDLGGTVTFKGIRKKGTTITVKIPLEKGGRDVYNPYRRRSSDRPAGT